MKKLFVVSCYGMSDLFFKAEDQAGALRKFSQGFTEAGLKRYTLDRTFRIREVTMPLLMKLSPDEFRLDEDTGF